MPSNQQVHPSQTSVLSQQQGYASQNYGIPQQQLSYPSQNQSVKQQQGQPSQNFAISQQQQRSTSVNQPTFQQQQGHPIQNYATSQQQQGSPAFNQATLQQQQSHLSQNYAVSQQQQRNPSQKHSSQQQQGVPSQIHASSQQQHNPSVQSHAPSPQQHGHPNQNYVPSQLQQGHPSQNYALPQHQSHSSTQGQSLQQQMPVGPIPAVGPGVNLSQLSSAVLDPPLPVQVNMQGSVEQPAHIQVETVSDGETERQALPALTPEATPALQYRPNAIEGTGVDARAKADPKVEAEQKVMSTAGAPGSASGRVTLLQAALTNRLPQFLVEEVLENPSLSNVKNPAAAKVHTVELLKLLTMDPGYGLKFKLILDEIPAWKKYKTQDHSLFITSVEQKADYFLTDGSTGEPKKLLTQG